MTTESNYSEPVVLNNHFREEPQPLSPARRKVSFRNSGIPGPRSTAREAESAPAQHRPHIDHLSGHDFLVNPSPKPKKKPRPKHFYESVSSRQSMSYLTLRLLRSNLQILVLNEETSCQNNNGIYFNSTRSKKDRNCALTIYNTQNNN